VLESWTGRVALGKIRDGTGNTLMLGEKHLRRTNQTGRNEDRSVFCGDHEVGPVGREAGHVRDASGQIIPESVRAIAASPDETFEARRRFGGRHPGVCMFAFCDGSVRPLRVTIDTETLARLAGREDGLVPGDY
jgi:prepilin-type processing-associated H-X9-DG protein